MKSSNKKLPSTFRLSRSTRGQLLVLSEKLKISMTEVVETAVDELSRMHTESRDEGFVTKNRR